MEAKKLVLDNSNGQLDLNVFFQLNISPPRSRLPHYENLSDQLFVVSHNGSDFLVRLVEIWFIQFQDINDMTTLLLSGIRSAEWKEKFLEKHPDVMEETEMAIYCYQKEKQ